MDKKELREVRKRKLPLVTTFTLRESLSELNSPLGILKEFAEMEQRLEKLHPKEEDRLFCYHSSEDRIVFSHALLANELLTDLDFFNNKVKSPKIEEMMPKMMKIVGGGDGGNEMIIAYGKPKVMVVNK